MKKLFFISFFIGIVISFNSCNVGEAGNYVTSDPAPAVIGYKTDMGGNIICSFWGYYAAPSLSPTEYYEDDCLFIQFSIDYDNQPSDKYFTATNIVGSRVDWNFLQIKNQSELDDYNLPISSSPFIYSSPYYNGKFFIVAETKNKDTTFRLLRDPGDENSNGVINLYLQAKPSGTQNSIELTSTAFAFDMRSFIINQNTDTTINYSDGRVDYHYIRANLHYVSEVSESGVPKYEKALINDGKPVEILIFKNN